MANAFIHVPAEYSKRKKLWVNASVWLGVNEPHFGSLSIQSLGYAERLLLEMEGQLSLDNFVSRNDRDRLLMECSAHSALWVFGLYEILRVIKQSNSPKFEGLAPLFRKLENLRMPLAKHELKKMKPKEKSVAHFPTGTWDYKTGQVGWIIIDPRSSKQCILNRTPLANEFLSYAAVEPDTPFLVPIGGPLGRDD
jgi:hypothetical protein